MFNRCTVLPALGTHEHNLLGCMLLHHGYITTGASISFPICWMVWIDRPSIGSDLPAEATVLLLCLATTMVCHAERLQCTEPEAVLVTMVRDHVIGHLRRYNEPFLQAHHAERMIPQLRLRTLPPARGVIPRNIHHSSKHHSHHEDDHDDQHHHANLKFGHECCPMFHVEQLQKRRQSGGGLTPSVFRQREGGLLSGKRSRCQARGKDLSAKAVARKKSRA